MFQEEYKELMSEVRPSDAIVEEMIKQSAGKQKRSTWNCVSRVVTVALCAVLVLGGGTLAIDAATDGAVREFLGLKDSAVIGADEVIFINEPHEERGWGTMLTIDENGGSVIEIRYKEDQPIFVWNFKIGDKDLYGYTYPMSNDAPRGYITRSLCSSLKDAYYEEFKKGTPNHEAFLAELEKCLAQLNMENYYQRECAQGIRAFKDELTSE